MANPFHGAPILYSRETGSTMDDARVAWARNPTSGLVVATDYQRSGRGRREDRRWVSAPGESLMFTLTLARSKSMSPDRTARLPIDVGCGVAALLRSLGLAARVKWPNDVLVQSRKLAGILVETVAGGFLIGLGLNCNQRRFASPLEKTATSMRLESGREFDPMSLLPLVLAEIRRYTFGQRQSHVEPMLWGIGLDVAFRTGQSTIFGSIRGVDATGALLIRTASGTERMISGEIVRIS